MSQASSRPFQGVVTPEAVVLSFETAGVGSRTAAALVDWTLRLILYVVFLLGSAILDAYTGFLPGWLGVTIITLMTFVLLVAYPAIFETFWNGRTPGKAALGLRVTTVEGGPIRFRHAAIRAGLGVFEILATFGALGWLTMFVSKQEQRLGDMVAGTLVLRDRQARRRPEAVAFAPVPGTEDYASTLDVSGLSSDDYLQVRSYLTRAGQLRGSARVTLSEQLARELAQRLQAMPPPWMTAEVFLVCVAAAYQRRFAPPTPGM